MQGENADCSFVENDMNTHLCGRGRKLQLHNAIYRLRFYSNSLIHILSLSNAHNNVASLQKNQGDKSHRAIVALQVYFPSLANFFVRFLLSLKSFRKYRLPFLETAHQLSSY